ncbi:hypothetical protein H310_09171 [Aphanomyces invadans]|uniref:Myosin motor domain-containing protein n=1 Tax=Aphanomyces invadans TaxID=157072 RepID=A0A024TUW0_9STRA|nr:hypothetical protein H310_09171 [Aphanomyces invadans]ETV97823.1 hypothetical protein H310_09171 [Aphanomyces invadans]|eukprot:XP_008873384.1 hypothetical protein H310_09171 [Aphanomyces invadans]
MNEGPVWGRRKGHKDGATYAWIRGVFSGDMVEFDDGQCLPWSTIESEMEVQRGNVVSPMELDDLGMLTHLNEPSMVHCLEERFLGDKVYCHTGDMLLAVNPFKTIPTLYDISAFQTTISNAGSSTNRSPHVYTTAHETYRALTVDKHKSQTVLVSGESGSGKTETTKFIMQYLAVVSSDAKAASSGSSISDQVLQSNPILESFGNARTLRNDNSSRFGKFVKIWFAKNGHARSLSLVGTSIETYLLEKVRLVRQAAGERNFHIFYEVLAGAAQDRSLQTKLHLHDCDPSKFYYLNQSGCVARRDNVSDVDTFHKAMRAMSIVGFHDNEKDSILELVGGLLHLGNIKFGSVATGDAPSSDIRSPQELTWVAQLLAVDLNRLRQALTTRQIKAKDEWYVVHLTPDQANDARDALARSIYVCLFEWLVSKVNMCIAGSSAASHATFIGVLDIFGFESFDINSFEQLCINYANERLQHHFIDFVMTQEQGRYHKEGIPWTTLDLPQNDGCLEVLESRPTGILALLDEECNIPKGTDAGFVRKLYQIYHGHNHFQATKRDQVDRAFVVMHYAGAVRYMADGFCEKNRDKPHQAIYDLLSSSENPFICVMCRPLDVPVAAWNDEHAPVLRRKSSIVSTGLGAQFRRQLQHLLDMITLTTPHYIRCLKPNDANVKLLFDRKRMADQLRYGGVLEAVTISRLGYPVHLVHHAFVSRYAGVLLPPMYRTVGGTSSQKFNGNTMAVDTVLTHLVEVLGSPQTLPERLTWPRRDVELSKTTTRSKWFEFGMERGKTLVFLRQATYDFLEAARATALHKHAVVVQAFAKMSLCRHRYLVAQQASGMLQRVIRGHLARQQVRRQTATRTAAVLLQARYRGWVGRHKVRQLRQHLAAICVQRWWRGSQQRRVFAAVVVAVLTIQCAWRSRVAKAHVKQLKQDAMSLKHTIAERNQLREELHLFKAEATMANQRAEEAEKELRRVKQLLLEMQQTAATENGAPRVPRIVVVEPSQPRVNSSLGLPAKVMAVVETLTEIATTAPSPQMLGPTELVKLVVPSVEVMTAVPEPTPYTNSTKPADGSIESATCAAEAVASMIAPPVQRSTPLTILTPARPSAIITPNNVQSPSRLDAGHFLGFASDQVPTASFTPRGESGNSTTAFAMTPPASMDTAFDRQRRRCHPNDLPPEPNQLDVLLHPRPAEGDCTTATTDLPSPVVANPPVSLSLQMDLPPTPSHHPRARFVPPETDDEITPATSIDDTSVVTKSPSQAPGEHTLPTAASPPTPRSIARSTLPQPAPIDCHRPLGYLKPIDEEDGAIAMQHPPQNARSLSELVSHRVLDFAQVEAALQRGDDPDVQDTSGRTMLHLAVEMGHVALVDLLLQHRASVTITDYTCQATAFHVAAKMANMEVSGIFCRPDVFPLLDVNVPDKDGNTVLHLACASARPKAAYVMELYLTLGADPNAQNVLGRTPLHICTLMRRDDELIMRLLAFGADPNVYSIDKKTPLHIAAKRGSIDQAIALVKHGASMTLPDANLVRVLHTSDVSSQLLPYIIHPPQWIPDDDVANCMVCKYEFNFFVRRHHCRRCGAVCCSDCLDHKTCRLCVTSLRSVL